MIETNSKPVCSIIIPCFNEENAIKETLDELFSDISNIDQFEIIVVNDGSTDKTVTILEQIQQNRPSVKILYHDHNRGYGASLKTGIRSAESNLIAITDADSTYPNERIPELVNICIKDDYDMVVGARTTKNVKYSKIRAIPKFFLRLWMSWIADYNIPDINSGMRVFKKNLAEQYFGILPDSFSFTVTITLAMLTNYRKVLYVPINYYHRTGQSKIRPIKDTLNFIMLILRTGVYFAPIKIFSPIILVLGLLSFISLTYDAFLLHNLTDKTVLLFLFTMNTSMFALLADMIDKRTMR